MMTNGSAAIWRICAECPRQLGPGKRITLMLFDKTRETFQAACILLTDFGLQLTAKELADRQAQMMVLVRNGANRYEAAIATVLAIIAEAVFTDKPMDAAAWCRMAEWLWIIERLACHATFTLYGGDREEFSLTVHEVRMKLMTMA